MLACRRNINYTLFRATTSYIFNRIERTCLMRVQADSAPDLSRRYLRHQMVKNLPAMQETWVRSLGGEDPLEEVMAMH